MSGVARTRALRAKSEQRLELRHPRQRGFRRSPLGFFLCALALFPRQPESRGLGVVGHTESTAFVDRDDEGVEERRVEGAVASLLAHQISVLTPDPELKAKRAAVAPRTDEERVE